MVTELVPFGVVLASLLGSAHCAAMCGPLTLLLGQEKRSHMLWHFGRLSSYALLGAAAGGMGERLLGSSALHWVSWGATILLALGFIAAAVQILRGHPLHLPLPRWLSLRVTALFQKSGNPVLLGLASVLLPCGWLYTFALGAAATQSPWRGALFLTAFWIGTLPALAGAQILTSRLHKLQGKAPVVAAVLLISLAIGSISARVLHGRHEHSAERQNHSHSHGEHHEQPGTH